MDRIARTTPTRTTASASALTSDGDSHRTPAAVTRTSRFHYAQMRCAEDTARGLSQRHSAHVVLGGLTGIPWEQVTEIAAARDSYYQLAAAHRAAARRRERVENLAAAWADFRDRPVYIVGVYASSYARDVRRFAQTVRRAVTR